MKTVLYPLTTLVFLFIVMVVICCNLPYSALSLQNDVQKYTQSIIPQGWQFFTLNPRSEQTVVFKKNRKGKFEPINFRNSSSESLFGLSKINRIKNIELTALLSQIDSNYYLKCEDEKAFKLISDTLKPHVVFDFTNIQSMRGVYLIRKMPPIPWAWYGTNPKLFMPSTIIKIDVHEFSK